MITEEDFYKAVMGFGLSPNMKKEISKKCYDLALQLAAKSFEDARDKIWENGDYPYGTPSWEYKTFQDYLTAKKSTQ